MSLCLFASTLFLRKKMQADDAAIAPWASLVSLTALICRVIAPPAQQDPLPDEASTASLASQPFPFLALPLEIRLQILRYLCPNNDCNILCQTPRTLRTDGYLCSTAIFLINRQIYTEVRDEWYGHVYYRARIHPTGFHIHGYVSSLYREPPKTLGYVRCLDLEIQLKTPGWMDWNTDRKEPMGLYRCKEFLDKCVRDGRMDKVRKLRLGFGVSIVCFEYYRDRTRELRGDLEREMKGLRKLRGLTKVQFTGIAQGYGYHGTLPSRILGSSGKATLQAMNEIMEDFVQALVAELRRADGGQTSLICSRHDT
ncbi:hypothetical protein BKA65DRAFT_471710 [Rhexocercosporidium sp. MPI-PUGE-AT-0058]|nr:hypothetical protein BKA65DRAFT_471710 [Rhexocercosporidium sp. MPI-PUGE-AT-0058]